MTVVVDTNVVAYYLLGAPEVADASKAALTRAGVLLAPSHWDAELTNVLWMAVRSGVLAADAAPVRLGWARRLGIESIPTSTLSQGALQRSIASGIAVYDTLFVELAVRSKCPLITFDKAVLKAFPGIAVRPGEGV